MTDDIDIMIVNFSGDMIAEEDRINKDVQSVPQSTVLESVSICNLQPCGVDSKEQNSIKKTSSKTIAL